MYEQNNIKDIEINFGCECPNCSVSDICKNYGCEIEFNSINFTNDRLKENIQILEHILVILDKNINLSIFPFNLVRKGICDIKISLERLIISPNDLQSK